MQKMTLLEKFFWHAYDFSQKKWVFWPVITISIVVILFHYLFQFSVNFSNSTPNRYYIFERYFDHENLKLGDIVRYQYTNHAFFPAGTKFVKIVGGLPGDKVEHIGQDVYVEGRHIGAAKLFAGPDQNGAPLEIGPVGKIPEGHYFLYTESNDSFDSRYEYVGFADKYSIVGKAVLAWGSGPEPLYEE